MTRSRALSRGPCCVFVLCAAACGSALPTAPLGPHRGATAPIEVDAPPPPAKIETVPRDPGGACSWLDGRWEWVSSAWEWTPGAWIVPPSGCHFAPPEALWVPSAGRGQLFYLPGRWYRDDGGARPCEVRRCTP